MIEFRALGPLTVVVDGAETSIGGPRQRRLLAMLLVHRGEVVSVDRLAEAVFEGAPTEAARTTMRSYIARIRKVITGSAPDVELVTRAPGYGLVAPAEWTDVGRFEALLAEGTRQLGSGDPALASMTIGSALDIFRGGAYAEFADEEWVLPEAQRLEELRLVAVERLIDAELGCGRAAESIARLETLVVDHPLREAFRGQLMVALYRTGRQVDALRAARDFRSMLADEVGLDPSPTIVDLERRILDHDPALDLGEEAGEPLRGYRLGRRLGIGPNGTMYEARLAGIDQPMVISVLDDARVDAPGFVQSFEANAQRIASLAHPAVVPIHDYWRQPGTAYVVTRRLTSQTLRVRLERAAVAQDDIDQFVVRIGGALVEASCHGLRHGWITLDSIAVDERGQMLLTSFAVCPATARSDVADFTAVVRALAGRCHPPLPEHVARRIDAVLDDPGDSIEELVAAFTRGLAAEPDVAGVRPNPFKGLRAFDEADAAVFHGREALVDELARRLGCSRPCRLTLLVGGSGSGKSSVVRAGLVPAVRTGRAGQGWYVTTMLPGSSPFKELAEALRRIAATDVADLASSLRDGSLSLDEAAAAVVPGEGSVLLVIDQFEELFTMVTEADQRAFLDVIADAATARGGRFHVVATLRADFYDRPLGFQRFGALVGDATVTVPAMSPSEIESAIVRPVETVGADADPALVAELVAAVVDQPAALPSLQFTLFELAERRPDRSLTVAGYDDVGGIDRAIAGRAEQLYLAADVDGRAAIRVVFEQLVVVDVDSEPTGRRSPLSDIGSGPAGSTARRVVDEWSAARLLTLDHDPRSRIPTVQVAHEALLRSWPRLRQWIGEDRDALVERHHLREAAAAWQRMERDEAGLYRGVRLDAALAALADDSVLPPADAEFLDASRALRERELSEARDRSERQARANRRLRTQLAVIAMALVAALVVGFIAVDQRGRAQDERDAADAARRNATARELAAAAEANVDIDAERAVLLALRAVHTTRSVDGTVLPQALDALHRAVTSNRVLVTVPGIGGRLDWNPTDDSFVTEGPEESGMIDIRSATTGDSLRSWRGDDVDVNAVVYSSDGTMLAVAGDDGVLKVFDPRNGTLVSSFEGVGSVWDPRFSADGSRLLAQWIHEERIRTIDPRSGEVLGEVEGAVQALTLSPDGTRALVGNPDEPYGQIFDDRAQPVIDLDVERPSSWAWSPDGTRVAAGGDDGVLRVVDAETGELLASDAGHDSSIGAVGWSADGTRLATGSMDGTARVWRFGRSILVEELRLQAQDLAAGVASVVFSPEGDRLAVGDFAVTATMIFDITPTGGRELFNLEVEPWLGGGIAGDQLVSVAPDRVARRTDLETGQERHRFVQPEVAWDPGVRVDPTERWIAVQPSNGDDPSPSIEVRDLDDGRLVSELDIADGPFVSAMSWSPDGSKLAVANFTDAAEGVQIVLFDALTADRLGARRFPGMWIDSLSLSPDGSRLAFVQRLFARADPVRDVVQVWEWETDDIVTDIPIPATRVAFDPSGTRLALTRFNDDRAQVVDAATGDLIATLSGSASPLLVIGFTPDGSSVFTGGEDGTIRFWDPETGDEELLLDAGNPLVGAFVDPTGTRLVSFDAGNLARVWTLDVDELVSLAESRLTRDLTDAECQRFLGTPTCQIAD